ncbi:MAG: hypothetical protein Q8R47_02745 [Nanoarchaeota archaeon]|nr:hypothetical protein [Nanoarchaeota archaeon]
MSEEPDLEELIAQNNSVNQEANLSFKDKALQHLKYFVVDGTGYAAYYGFFMTITERASRMDWEEIKRTRAIGAITGFLSGYLVNLLRGLLGKEKKDVKAEDPGSSLKVRKAAVDIVVGTATTMPFYAPILYYAHNSKFEGMELPLIIGSVVAGVVGLGYGHFADWWRRRWNLPGVLYK